MRIIGLRSIAPQARLLAQFFRVRAGEVEIPLGPRIGVVGQPAKHDEAERRMKSEERVAVRAHGERVVVGLVGVTDGRMSGEPAPARGALHRLRDEHEA